MTENQSRPFIRRALEAGINIFDAANMYSEGASEEILGRAIKDLCAPSDQQKILRLAVNPLGRNIVWSLSPAEGAAVSRSADKRTPGQG
jgi:hypothetical protein